MDETKAIEKPTLIQRLRSSSFVNYFWVALTGLIVDYFLLIFCKEVFHAHYLIATITGFVGGLVVNYYLSNRYVFKNPKLKSATANFGLFLLIGATGLGILNLLMFLSVSIAGINYIVAKTLATAVVYLWNFFARRSLYQN